jgi:hypothetical protein
VKTSKKVAKKKAFDSVASKREAQARIYRRIKGKNAEQELAYFNQATDQGPFAQFWKQLVTEGRKASTSGRLPRTGRQSA